MVRCQRNNEQLSKFAESMRSRKHTIARKLETENADANKVLVCYGNVMI